VGRFAYLAERGGGRTILVRQNCLEQFWTAAGWPRSAQRAGVRPMDGTNNPSVNLWLLAPHPEMRFAFLAERCSGRTLSVTRHICASPFGPSAAPMFALASCFRIQLVVRNDRG
jgi:hypothetical protein